jgi:hypothetical protein
VVGMDQIHCVASLGLACIAVLWTDLHCVPCSIERSPGKNLPKNGKLIFECLMCQTSRLPHTCRYHIPSYEPPIGKFRRECLDRILFLDARGSGCKTKRVPTLT